jgi:hypothetical protein
MAAAEGGSAPSDHDAVAQPPSSEGMDPQASGGSGSPSSCHISIFLRVRPTPRPTNRIVLEPLDGDVAFHMPRDAAAGCAAVRVCLRRPSSCCTAQQGMSMGAGMSTCVRMRDAIAGGAAAGW